MYQEFYKLEALPFQLTPDHRFFFGSAAHNRAMAHLTYGLAQGEGFIIITGDVGAGKTTLVGYLLSTLDPDRFVAAKIVTTQLEADDMLRMVSSTFGLPTEGLDKASLLNRLEAFLEDVHESGRRALLVVDEAQNLSVRALEELRMLSNFQIGEVTPLQCFLLGQPQFRQILANPALEQLRQRVIASYHLGPLASAETRAYVEHRMKLAGWDGDPEITGSAYEQVHKITAGVPRKVNTLFSRILLYGYLEELHRIDGPDVIQVAEEQEQEIGQIIDSTPMGEISLEEPMVHASGKGTNGSGSRHEDSPTNGAAAIDTRRIENLESHVELHDRIIKRTLRAIASYLEGRPDDR
ncbi:XrtA/PEP-CTERM system-associated ATPase [Oceanibacterium hippocampi]|uniref:AAA+ ATPase domain-containing protein n=1 Tax=Oceanibacterium hippocampi TaxID=745714 RepID=A0A1Y5TQF2_9PROT|nr:XrtA/PEP-CTERM system-associated ATPase [Oceanibacterium hippocampi]SLN69095.1 hypothetical protein OCH7691_03155 [Oceanibacterium hippocampi]